MDKNKAPKSTSDIENDHLNKEKMICNLNKIEKFINTYNKSDGIFSFPDDFKNLALNDSEFLEEYIKDPGFATYWCCGKDKDHDWILYFDLDWYEYWIGNLLNKYGNIEYIPFAKKYDATNLACFLLDNRNNTKIIEINPFWPYKPDVKHIDNDFKTWLENISI